MRKPTQPFTPAELEYIERETARAQALEAGSGFPVAEDITRQAVTLQMGYRELAELCLEQYQQTGDKQWLRLNQKMNGNLAPDYRIE